MRRYFARRGYPGRPGRRSLLIVVVLGLILLALLSNRRGCDIDRGPAAAGCNDPRRSTTPID